MKMPILRGTLSISFTNPIAGFWNLKTTRDAGRKLSTVTAWLGRKGLVTFFVIRRIKKEGRITRETSYASCRLY
jgi:hypothetical protein